MHEGLQMQDRLESGRKIHWDSLIFGLFRIFDVFEKIVNIFFYKKYKNIMGLEISQVEFFTPGWKKHCNVRHRGAWKSEMDSSCADIIGVPRVLPVVPNRQMKGVIQKLALQETS